MGKKYKVNCLAITDRLGNMHRNQNVTYEGGKAIVEDVILDESDFDPDQIKNYLESGHIVEHEVKKVEPAKKSGRPKKD